MRYFAGLDVSLEESSICIVDEAGRIVKELRSRSEPEGQRRRSKPASPATYIGSPHHTAWLAELRGEGDKGSGVTCATCHMP